MKIIASIINTNKYPVLDKKFRDNCADTLARDGALVLPQFITDQAVNQMRREAEACEGAAYFCAQSHNVYLTEPDSSFAPNHPRNREMISSKGCICDDQVAQNSPLRALYDAPEFLGFLCAVLGEEQLHPYEDPLSSINIHYAREGQELGWHFDNSSFATTLLIAKPEGGGQFEYVKDVRDADAGEFNFNKVDEILTGRAHVNQLEAEPGTLMLFRGRNSLHRVTPTIGDKTRLLAVLAYNSEPGVSLSEQARMTFYGRLD